ncbi:alpha/beta fold hydrolase [Georgenia faecalis]|uniref:Alpha/beta fold hydrolase n=1 Tax=Georgenia faecalis TaxID=2483799 RepID=A0ABV9D6G8_9MICO|nr:alpha/beta fold hydrolase [Georgenia faecalis]
MLVLLASPFLGPAAWEPVARALARLGHDVLVPEVPAPRAAADVLAAHLAAIPDDRPVTLVPHSNAGTVVPALVARRRVRGVVFVDAVVPAASGRHPVAPPALVADLAPLADAAGDLPPWTSWFPPDAVDPLFPDRATRTRLEARLPRVPLAYLRDDVAVPDGWRDVPAAYLAFGDTYDAERRLAGELGWPVRTLTGGHLHLLADPDAVAAAVDVLARRVRAA